MKTIRKFFVIGLVCAICAACAKQGGVSTEKVKGKALRVGALLPLSGKYKVYGESTLHGIECGAGKVAPCPALLPVEIVAKDSGGDPERAAAAVTELVQQDQVNAIIGPLLSRTVEAAALRAQDLKIPLISLSQRDGVAEIGDYIFRIGINAASQVETLAKYAVKERGFKKLAIVYPSNTYGQTFASAFRGAITALGASIVSEKSYGPEIANIIEARNEGGPEESSATSKPKTKPGSLSTSGEVVGLSPAKEEAPMPVIPHVRGAEAVFIPDSYRNVLALLHYGGPDVFGGAALLGVNRWNSAGLLEGGSRVEGAVFVDAFFRDSGDSATEQFVRGFSEAYHMDPTVLEAQSFDAMRVLIKAALDARSRAADKLKASLAKIKNFPGVTGRMTFNAEGDAIKQLHLLTVRGGVIQTLDGHGKSSRRDVPPSEKYDVGGATQAPAQPVRTERGKYEPEIQ